MIFVECCSEISLVARRRLPGIRGSQLTESIAHVATEKASLCSEHCDKDLRFRNCDEREKHAVLRAAAKLREYMHSLPVHD